MEENPETVLIGVETNCDTNLVVIPPRSATIAEVREKIVEGHRVLYPAYGTIDIRAVKVEMFSRHFRLEDSHAVGQIFRGWQGCLHVELAGYPPYSSTLTGSKLAMISAPEKAPVSSKKIRKQPLPGVDDHGDVIRNVSDKPPLASPKQPEISHPGQRVHELLPVINGALTLPAKALDDIGSPKSSGGRNSSEKFSRDVSKDVVHRQSGADGQGNLMIETGLDTTLDALLNAGPEGSANEDGNKDCIADSNGCNVANKDTFGGAQGSTPSSPVKTAGLEIPTSGDSGISGKRKKRAVEPLNLSGSQSHQLDLTTSQDVHKQDGGSATKRNRVREKSNVGMVKIHESLVKAIPDFDEKIADEKDDVRASPEISSSESGSEIALNQESKLEGYSRQGAQAELLDVSVPLEGDKSGRITQSKVSEEGAGEATQGGKPHAKSRSRASRSISSGSSTSGSSEKSESKEPLETKAPGTNLQVEPAKARHESSDESNSSGESSKSYRPGGSSGTRDVDDVVNKLVDLYSPIISHDSGGEESSDASEELQPKDLRRRMNSKALDEADDAVRKSRRAPRAVSGLSSKFQHFIDSQDGLDELLGLTLSSRKAKTSAQVQNEPQQHVADTGSAAHDSLSIDRVPDTQVPEAIRDAGAQREGYTEEIMNGEGTTGKGSKTGDGKSVHDGSLPDVRQNEKDEKRSSKSKSKQTDLSADTKDVPPESLKNFASIASESGRRLDLNEDLLQPKSDDSQQFQAAVQLTRLAMADEDEAESDPMQSPRTSPIEKKKKKKTKVKPADSSFAIPRENDQPDNIEESVGIDLARSALATVTNIVEKHSTLLAVEHSPEGGVTDRAGTCLNPVNIQGGEERPVSDCLEKSQEEMNGVQQAPRTSVAKSHDGSLQLQMDEGRPTEAVSLDEDPVANCERSELATPSKPVEKKLNTRRIRYVKSPRSTRTEGNELDTTETGGDRRGKELANTTKQTDSVVDYVEDSPEKDGRSGADGLDEPSILEDKGEVRPLEKSGRKKKVKKCTRLTDSTDNERREERSNWSLLEENENLVRRGIDEKESLRRRWERQEVGAEDGLGVQNEAAVVVTPQKRKKKKLKADVESHLLEAESISADEARSRVKKMKSNSNVSSHPSHADGGFGSEILTSGISKEGMGPRGETIALPEESPQRVVDEESPVAVSKKKARKKKASTLLYAEEKDADVGMGQKELNQVTSDGEAVMQVPGVGHTKPPKPRKKATKNSEFLSPPTEKANLMSTENGEALQDEQHEKFSPKKQGKVMRRRKLVEEVEFAEVEDKQVIGSVEEVAAEKFKALDNGAPVESEKRKVKQRKTPSKNEEVAPSDLQKINSSLTKDDGIAMNEGIRKMGTFENSREVRKKGTPKARKKKSSVAGDVNAGIVEPGSSQVAYRGSDESEFNRDVTRNAKPLDDMSRVDGSVEGYFRIKQGKKRGKSVMSDVEDTVGAPTHALEKSGTKTPNAKRKKHLSSPGMYGVTVTPKPIAS